MIQFWSMNMNENILRLSTEEYVTKLKESEPWVIWVVIHCTITARKWSLRQVMFSQVFFSPQEGSAYRLGVCIHGFSIGGRGVCLRGGGRGLGVCIRGVGWVDPPPQELEKRAVHILLECSLVRSFWTFTRGKFDARWDSAWATKGHFLTSWYLLVL